MKETQPNFQNIETIQTFVTRQLNYALIYDAFDVSRVNFSWHLNKQLKTSPGAMHLLAKGELNPSLVVGGDGEGGLDDGAPGVRPANDALAIFASVLVGAWPGLAVRVSAGTAPAAERVVLHLQTHRHATVSILAFWQLGRA